MPPLGEHADSRRPYRCVHKSVKSPGNGNGPETAAEARDPVQCYRRQGASHQPEPVAVRFGDSTVGHVTDCKAPQEARVDDSDLNMREVELLAHHGSGGPVVEATHVDEQVEGGVAEEDAVSPSTEFGMVGVGRRCHRCRLHMPECECVDSKCV